jgi:dihydropteroate synthase
VLNLETLVEIANQNQGDLSSEVAEFTVSPGRIQIGKTPQLMGVINLSDDSWYRESICLDTESAINRGKALHGQGASIIDIGAESTLPEAQVLDAAAQLERILPVVEALASSSIAVSVETYDVEVARQCLKAGAAVINLTGAGDSSTIFSEVARADAAVIICFVQGDNVREVKDLKLEDDPMPMLEDYFNREIKKAQDEGVKRIFIDPGLGFYYANLNDGEQRVRRQMRVFLNTFRLRKLGWPVCHALPHAAEIFQEQVRSAEPFFAILASLGKTSLFRTHEVPKVKAVLDTLGVY